MKIKYIISLVGALPFIFIVLLALTVLAGGNAATEPVAPPCTAETAEKYAIVCSELGVPWELVLIADTFIAHDKGESGIEEINPIFTGLEFTILEEVVEVYVNGTNGEGEEGGEEPGGDDGVSEDSDDEEDGENSGGGGSLGWVYSCTNEYIAKDEILDYADLRNNIANLNPSALLSKAQKVADEKSDESTRYTVNFAPNPDYETILKEYLHFSDDDIEDILELYDSRYLAMLYFGESYNFIGEYELPAITVGSVSRDKLAQVAVSIIGHPYYWGGKSNVPGPPNGGLDCSGYIDWVYVQCFGRGVNGGRIAGAENIIMNGTATQFYSCSEISESDLKIGDLGFYKRPEDVTDYNHVGIYIGEIDGRKAFIHCGGDSFGYKPERPSGRVGISINDGGTANSKIPNGGTFSPPMNGSNFRYFRRPQFQFLDDV